MKKFKKFLEENLLRQSLLEISGRNEGLFSMIPDTQSSAIGGFYGAGGLSNRRPVIFPPQNPQKPTNPNQRLPFLIYDDNGNVIGTDFNGDGQPDTEEELQQWRDNGLPPSEWLVDQPFMEQWFYWFWNIGQWVFPFGNLSKVYGLWTRLTRMLEAIIANAGQVWDYYDLLQLLQQILSGNLNGVPAALLELIQNMTQELGQWLLENGVTDPWGILERFFEWYQGIYTDNPGSIPKQFYRKDEFGRLQLWRFNPSTGTWEKFGEPITLQDYYARCQSGNCPPIDAGQIPFKEPLPRPDMELDPLFVVEPSQNTTNDHWRQIFNTPNSNNGNQPPNPEIWQM